MGILSVVLHPTELVALFRLKSKVSQWKKRSASQKRDADWVFCYDMLNKVSRSFAIVIEQLGDELRNAICIFYLVLRGLDTVEDDMAIDKTTKAALLLDFHNSIEQEGFTLSYGYKDEKVLLEKFDAVVRAYLTLKPEYRAVIREITRRMAEGMQLFTVKRVQSVEDYDLYCHYVAGLVGIGLSQMFAASGLEDSSIASSEENANHMGLFLQKTNIIRDFLEDHEDLNEQTGDRRVFWPKEIWGQYTDSLENFTFGKSETQAVACLNHMVTDAMRHLPYCIEYLSSIKDYQNFLFCAIPQVMAAHTLSLCYANPDVFKGVIRKDLGECRNLKPVKIRKGLSCKLMLDASDMESVLEIFEDCIESISDRISPTDPSSVVLTNRIQSVRDLLVLGRRSDSPTSKLSDGWWEESKRSMRSTVHSYTPLLLVILLANSLIADLPLALGSKWLGTSNIESGPGHLAMTCWCVCFYIGALICVSKGIQRYLFCASCLHFAFSIVELAIALKAATEVQSMVADAVPKILGAGAVGMFSFKPLLRKLTPSHPLKVLKFKQY